MKKNVDLRSKLIAVLLIFAVIIVFYLLKAKFDFAQIADIEYIRASILSFGAFAPLVYILIMAVAIIISPIPSLPLDAAAGVIWGPYLATIYSVIGAEIGAIIAFLIARNLGRDVLQGVMKKYDVFSKKYSEKTLTIIVLVSRLFPFFQFDIISYGAGLTRIRLRNFAIATFFGMIPMTFLFAYFGKSVFAESMLAVILSLLIIILMFVLPIFLGRNKLFGLKKK